MNTTRALSLAFATLLSIGAAACGSDQPVANEPSPPAPTEEATASAVDPAPTASASAQTPPAEPPAVSIEEAVKKFVAESTAAWASKDPKKHTALYTPDAVVAITGPKGWEEAKAADMEKSIGGYFTAFPDLEVTYTRVVARGNYAVAEWTFTGTNTGEMMGKPATKKKVGYRAASVLTFAKDGKVQRETSYFDMGTMMSQLGLGPKGQPARAVEAKPAGATVFMFGTDKDSDTAARSWIALAETADTKALDAIAHEDVVVSNQYMAVDTKGKKALSKDLAQSTKAFVDQKSTVAMCVAAGAVVACEYEWKATFKGPAMGMKPTGKTGSVHSLEIIEVKDGKVAKTTAYANGVEFAGTFGLMEGQAGQGAPKGDKPAKGGAPKKK